MSFSFLGYLTCIRGSSSLEKDIIKVLKGREKVGAENF